MKFEIYAIIQLVFLLIGLILSGISIYLNQIVALQFGLLFVGISLLLFFFDINLKHRLRIYTLLLEIKNPELRQYGYDSLDRLEKSLVELVGESLSVASPFLARDIAFGFLKNADENTEILATQDFVSRPNLLQDELKGYFFSINKEALGRKAKVVRILVADNAIRNDPRFAEYCKQLVGMGCNIFHLDVEVFRKIVGRDFIISLNRKDQKRSKVLIGGRDKPEDEYVAKLSYRSDDINNYRKKFDMLLSSGVEFK